MSEEQEIQLGIIGFFGRVIEEFVPIEVLVEEATKEGRFKQDYEWLVRTLVEKQGGYQ